MNKNIKGQSALEFLTTYGWAFLIILIMVGTLAYFGILNPSKILPNRCNIGSEFQCIDFQVSATADTFRIRLKNNVGEPIAISSVTFDSEGATKYTCTTLTTPASLPSAWVSGNVIDFAWSGCNSAAAGMVAGEKGKVLITLTYNTVASGTNYAKTTKGEVYATVQ